MKVAKNPYGHRTNTAFFEKWSERPCDIAEREGITIHAVGMRIHNFGNPYQRVKNPALMEIYYGVTNYHMLLMTRVPQSILAARLSKMISDGTTSDIPWLMRKSRAKYDHNDLKSQHRPQVWGWLMPEHENYSDWWQRPEYLSHRVRDMFPEYKIAEANYNGTFRKIQNI